MKPLFFSLKAEKRDRILEACGAEFAAHDYEQANLDRIVEAAGISKGGLYEYIDSKDDLYLHVVGHTYTKMYGHLGRVTLPGDLLERFRTVSEAAIDFYLDHPRCIALLVRTSRLSDPALAARVAAVFDDHFDKLFATADPAPLAWPRAQLIDLMKALLAKTRADFLARQATGADRATLREAYLAEWAFLLSVLKHGIYQT